MARKKSRTKQKRIKALSATAQAILGKIAEESKQRPIAMVAGAFGDMEDCTGIIEAVIHPPDGGTLIKFYGNSYLFKGYPLRQIVEGLGLGKALISAIPRKIISKSFIICFALLLLSVFSRKRFIHYSRVYFNTLWNHTVYKASIRPEHYNKQAREIRRVVNMLVRWELTELKTQYDERITTLTHGDLDKVSDRELCELITCIGEFIALFIEYDNAYRFRIADLAPLLDKQKARDNVRREVGRVFDILIKREHPRYGIRSKWVDMKRVVMAFLLVSPLLRKWVRRFLLEMEVDAMSLDEHDKYFCLARRTYQFGGIPLHLRLKEKKRIDRAKGHIKLDIKEMPKADGSMDYLVSIPPIWQKRERKKRNPMEPLISASDNTQLSVDAGQLEWNQLLQP